MNDNSNSHPFISKIGGKPVNREDINASLPPLPFTPPEPDYLEAEPVKTTPPVQKTMAEKVRESSDSVQSGLVAYAVENADHQLLAMNALIKHSLGALDIRTLPKRAACAKVTYLFNGSSKDLELETLLTDPDVPPGFGEYKVAHCSPHAGFNWTADGCGYALASHLNGVRGGSVIISQNHTGTDAAEMVTGLRLLDKIAREKDVLVSLFLPVLGGRHKKARLSEHCSKYVIVQSCEPDIGQDYAFSFDCGNYRQLGRLGLPKMMCSVKLDHDQIAYSLDPFVSTQLEDRIIWMSRAQGKTLEEIGLKLRKNRSTILRRLQSVCGPNMRDVDKAWLESKLAAFSDVDKLE